MFSAYAKKLRFMFYVSQISGWPFSELLLCKKQLPHTTNDNILTNIDDEPISYPFFCFETAFSHSKRSCRTFGLQFIVLHSSAVEQLWSYMCGQISISNTGLVMV